MGDALPIHYQYDPDYQAYYPASTLLTVTPEKKTVTLTVSEFSSHVISWIEDFFQSTCQEEEPCRCGRFTVVEESRDKVYSKNDCQAEDIHGSITYHDCGPNGVTESWDVTEHSLGCVPKMILTAGQNLLEAENSTSISARVTYLDDPVPGVTVNLSTGNLLTLASSSVVTDENGVASTTVTAGTREGVAPVQAEASKLFASRIIAANGVEQESVYRRKDMSAKTYITIDVPAGLVIDILPGKSGDFLTFNESTKVEVAALDFFDSRDRSKFRYIPSVTVDLEATGGILASDQVTTLGSGPVTVIYTAPDVQGEVTIKGSATVETLTESGDPVTYKIDGEDSIDVKPEADWVGSLDLEYSGCKPEFGPIDPTFCMTSGYQFSYSVNVDFFLNIDEKVSSPSESNPNVTGTGTVSIFNVNCSDGPILPWPTGLGCGPDHMLAYEYFWDCVGYQAFPFESPIEGIFRENFHGTPYDLWILFQHPLGPNGTYVNFDAGEREICGGVQAESIFPSDGQIHWNPGIVEEWNPFFYNEGGFRVDLGNSSTVSKSGDCSSYLTETGGPLNCSYSLTMKKVEGK